MYSDVFKHKRADTSIIGLQSKNNKQKGAGMDEIKLNTIARATLEELQSYFADPEHEKAFQKWKEERGRLSGKPVHRNSEK